MSNVSNNINFLQQYIIRSLIEYFSRSNETITSRYVLYFDSLDNIVLFGNELESLVTNNEEMNQLRDRLGQANMNVSLLDPFTIYNEEGGVEYEAVQLKVSNNNSDRTIVFIPDCDNDLIPLGDAFKNGIRNQFVDKHENKILFYLSVQNIASVSKTTENFQKHGMPLSVENVYNNLCSQISIISGENQREVVLYALNMIKSNKPQSDNSLLEFAPIIRIIETQSLSTNDFHDLHLFQMSLSDLRKKDRRLADNYKLYRDISLALADQEVEAVMSAYEPSIIKEIQKLYDTNEADWDKEISFEHILKYKKVNQKRFKVEQPILVMDKEENELSRDYYLDFIKVSSASFIIFSKDCLKEKIFKIGIRFTQKADAKSDEFNVEQANLKGTYYKIILDKTDFCYTGKTVFTGGKNNSFTVYVSVLNTSASFLADSCIGFTEKKSEYIYQLIAKDYQVKMGELGKNMHYTVNVNQNTTPIAIKTSDHTVIDFQYPDGEASKDHTFIFNVDDNSALLYVSVKFELNRLRRLHAYELFNKCYVGHDSFCLEDEKIINKHKHSEKYITEEIDVSGRKYDIDELLKLENRIISDKYLVVNSSSLKEIKEEKCNVPQDVGNAYGMICDYFINLGTMPSLCTINQELEKLYKQYIDLVLLHVGKFSQEFQDKQPITNEILSIFKLGMVFDSDGLIWLSPLTPLSVAYQLHLNSGDNRLIELDDYLYSSLGFGNIMPFISETNGKVFQAIKGSYPVQWACYCDAAQSIKGEENTYSQKIEDYYLKFDYLFRGLSNNTFMINIIGIYHTCEIISALLKLYKSKNIDNKTFLVDINYYYQGTGKNDFDNMSENDYVYGQAINYYGAKNSKIADDFCEWYSDHVKYYSHLDREEYRYAHITFCAIQNNQNAVLENTITDAKSGIMLEGLIADVPSSLDSNSGIYKYGFGAQYADKLIENSQYLQLANAYNELARCREGSPATRNSSIAQGVQNTKSKKLEKIYKSSNWVVFVEPKIDLDFFIEQSNENENDLIIIHYPDKNLTSSGYTSITVTQKSDQYIEVIKEYLEEHLPMYHGTMDVKNIIRNFNTYSGEWLMNFINNKQVEEKVSLVSAIAFCRKYFANIYPEYIWIPVALDEVLRVTGSIGGSLTNVLFSKKALVSRGIIENQNATSDDLLMAGIKCADGKVSVTYVPVEVKRGKVGPDTKKEAHNQVCNTSYLLKKSFLDPDDNEKGKRIDRKIYRNYMIQHVVSNIEKMLAYQITEQVQEYKSLIDSEIRVSLLNDLYDLEISDTTDAYAFYFVEGQEVVKRTQNSQDKVIELSLPISKMYEFLVDEKQIIEAVLSISDIDMVTDSTTYDMLVPEDYADDNDSDEGDEAYGELEDKLNGSQDKYPNTVYQEENDLDIIEHIQDSGIIAGKEKKKLSDIRVLIGTDSANNEIYWEFGNKQLANRHLLITGTSGQGKTYSIQTMLYELIQDGIPSVIFDYTEGFMKTQLEKTFVDQIGDRINEKIIYNVGVPINPFLRHEIDIAGTVLKEKAADVASRLADIFSHVYNFGDQQYSAIFTAVLNGINNYGNTMSMQHFQSELENVQETNKAAKTVISKMEPFFHTISFEGSVDFDWKDILYGTKPAINIFQLTLINREMQVIVTEMMLWDAWYYTKKSGNKDKPFVVILDEAQNLSHKANSPSAAILTEGRKFGWSAWFATQSLKVLKDEEVVRLSQSAFKLYFKPTDDEILKISKQLDPTGEMNWTSQVKNLKKGQCIVSGDRLRSDGTFGGTLPTVVSVSSLESRKFDIDM